MRAYEFFRMSNMIMAIVIFPSNGLKDQLIGAQKLEDTSLNYSDI